MAERFLWCMEALAWGVMALALAFSVFTLLKLVETFFIKPLHRPSAVKTAISQSSFCAALFSKS